METSSGESTPPKRNSRGPGSPGRAGPRRSTRGPLDISESPIHTPSPLSSPPLLPHNTSSLLSPSHSQYHTPRLPSPQIGSSLTYRTACTSLSPSTTLLTTQRDFSFLLRPEIYHPLTLLDVPPPFRTSTFQADPSTPLETLLATGHFRSAAIKAAQLLISTNPPLNPADPKPIFDLVYMRLACLTLCGQTVIASQEVKALEDLNSGYYRDEGTGKHLVPWELRVLAVRLQGMGFSDARRGVMGYFELAREARLALTGLKKARKVEEGGEGDKERGEEIKVWEGRLRELGVRVASALVEMEDLEGACRFLGTLKEEEGEAGRELRCMRALLWLCVGDVESARACISRSGSGEGEGVGEGTRKEEKVIEALSHMADSEFEKGVKFWEELIEGGTEDEGELAMWKQNLAVSLLYLGRMEEARHILENLIQPSSTSSENSPTNHSFHALTFNLSTIYELCTERSRSMKIGLAEKIAGIEEEKGRGWGGGEKGNGDFKL